MEVQLFPKLTLGLPYLYSPRHEPFHPMQLTFLNWPNPLQDNRLTMPYWTGSSPVKQRRSPSSATTLVLNWLRSALP